MIDALVVDRSSPAWIAGTSGGVKTLELAVLRNRGYPIEMITARHFCRLVGMSTFTSTGEGELPFGALTSLPEPFGPRRPVTLPAAPRSSARRPRDARRTASSATEPRSPAHASTTSVPCMPTSRCPSTEQ